MIDPSKLKPFDEDAALRGEPVCDRDGQPVTQLTKFHTDPGNCTLAGVCKGYLLQYMPGELRMAQKMREVWVRVQINRETGSVRGMALVGEKEESLNSCVTFGEKYSWIGPAVKAGEVEE